MPSSRDIKRRIKGVQSMEQITKAMKLVATSKVQKAKSRAEVNRFYFKNMMGAVSKSIGETSESKYLKPHKIAEKKKVLYILLSSDRGLCGGYNINLFKKLMSEINNDDENFFAISGKKAREFCHRKNFNVVFEKTGISENPTYNDAKEFGDFAIEKFISGEVDEVYIVYTDFISIINQEQKVFKLLPFDASKHVGENDSEEKKVKPVTLYEPSLSTVLDYVIPKYICSVIYGAFLEATASEEGSRMTAMDNATTNAEDISANLTLTYNRLRQGSITTEISEIVGGANALNA